MNKGNHLQSLKLTVSNKLEGFRAPKEHFRDADACSPICFYHGLKRNRAEASCSCCFGNRGSSFGGIIEGGAERDMGANSMLGNY